MGRIPECPRMSGKFLTTDGPSRRIAAPDKTYVRWPQLLETRPPMSSVDPTNEARILGKVALSVVISGWTAIILMDPVIGTILWATLLAGIVIYHYQDIRVLIRRWHIR